MIRPVPGAALILTWLGPTGSLFWRPMSERHLRQARSMTPIGRIVSSFIRPEGYAHSRTGSEIMCGLCAIAIARFIPFQRDNYEPIAGAYR